MFQKIQIFINSIIGKPTQEQLNRAVAIILAVLAILLKIFIINPLNISIARMYLESKSYKVKFGRLKYAFNKEYYLNIVKSVIVLDVYKFLWSLTLIGGIVKSYSYRMVNFIIAENPKIKPLNTLTLSRKMMNHYKMNAFLGIIPEITQYLYQNLLFVKTHLQIFQFQLYNLNTFPLKYFLN